MANASDLPTEIWLLIARYIPKSQLFRLKSLNSFFLNCWMDIKWRKVLIDTEFPHRAVRSLSRMVDPFVMTRTKSLTVCLRHFISKELPSSSSPKLSLSKKLTSILLSKPKSQPTTPTFGSALTHLLQSLPLMPHITTLKIELWHIPVALLPTLYQTITTSPIAKTIEKLRLSGHVDMFASLGEYSVTPRGETENSFGNLTEFNLELINRQLTHDLDISLSPVIIINDPSSILSLAHFVLSLSPSLQLLRIWNWSNTLDLSPFFSYLSQPQPDFPSLVPLPNLKSLFLILPFDTSPHSSSQPLLQFLLTHSNNLHHLQLRLKTGRVQLDPRLEEPLGTWLTNLVDSLAHESDDGPENNSSPFFPNLQSLDIYPSSIPAGLSALLTIIKRTAPTLSSLTIRDRYLTREEAKKVLDVLTGGSQPELSAGFRPQIQGQPPPPTTKTTKGTKDVGEPTKLKSLRMNITHLTVPFLDLLAHTLPQLQSLWLSASEIVGSDQFSRLYDPNFIDSNYLSIWKLRDLSIWQAGQKMDDVVRAVARAVPADALGSADYEPTDEE